MFSFWKKKSPTPERKKVTANELYKAILRDHDAILSSNYHIRLADTTYLTVTDAEAAKFISDSLSFYIPEVNDCDDRAFMAKAKAIEYQQALRMPVAFGILWTVDHALNWYMNYAGRIVLVDQQESFGVLNKATLFIG